MRDQLGCLLLSLLLVFKQSFSGTNDTNIDEVKLIFLKTFLGTMLIKIDTPVKFSFRILSPSATTARREGYAKPITPQVASGRDSYSFS